MEDHIPVMPNITLDRNRNNARNTNNSLRDSKDPDVQQILRTNEPPHKMESPATEEEQQSKANGQLSWLVIALVIIIIILLIAVIYYVFANVPKKAPVPQTIAKPLPKPVQESAPHVQQPVDEEPTKEDLDSALNLLKANTEKKSEPSPIEVISESDVETLDLPEAHSLSEFHKKAIEEDSEIIA